MGSHSQDLGISDERLLRAARAGDRAAFGTIVERYWNMTVALALSRVEDPGEAEDVAQKSFLKAYSQLRTLRDPTRFVGWLMTITRQECTDSLRRARRRARILGGTALTPERLESIPARSSNPGLTENQVQLVRQTVGNLPERFRQLIIMRFMGGLTAAGIAAQLGKRPSTVRVWLHRAYMLLRKDLALLLDEVEP